MGLEIQAVSKLGQSVALRAATEWLASNTDERTSSLTELAAAELSRPTQRAKLDTLIQHIGHQVTEQLESALERFTDGDIASSLTAVEEALSSIDLSDAALLADDADAEVLAQRIRRSLPRQDLGRCYEIALDQSCRYLVQIIRNLPSFQPRALAEVLSRATAQTAQLDDILARLPRASLYAPQGTDNDDEFRDEYLRYIATSLDFLELLGLSNREKCRLPLSVAYLSLTVSNRTLQQHDQRRDWFGDVEHRSSPSVRVESALLDRTLVLGEAGSGKTTLLDWLAVTAARCGFVGDLHGWNGLVPLPVRLRSYADAPLPEKPEELVAGLLSGVMPTGWMHRVLRAGRGLLLVDGVDEVPPAKRHKVHRWLHNFLNAFPSTRVVVTARPAAADKWWLFEMDFASVALEQMGPADVRMFLQRWHEAAGAPEEVHRRLSSQLASRQHLRALAASPLLCAMLCALNLGRVSELPHNRMELYAAALTMLLDFRDAERGIARMLTTSDKTVLLGDLAWRLTLGGRSQLSTTKLREHITRKIRSMPNVHDEPNAIVTHLLERSGVIREPVTGLVDFVHRTFQEYLAGAEAMQDGQVETLVGHAHQDSWTQTIVLACGHGQRTQVSELLTEILNRAELEELNSRKLRLLAAACLETARDLDAAVHERVNRMIEEHLVPPRNMEEAESLAMVGQRILRHLPQDLTDLPDKAANATVRATTLVGSPEAMSRLALYSRDPRADVQTELGKAWAYFDPKRFAEEVLARAPLTAGAIDVAAARMLPHLVALQHLKTANISFPDHEVQHDLSFAPAVPGLRFMGLHVAGAVSFRPLSTCKKLKVLWIAGADRYLEPDQLPRRLTSLGLFQLEPWESLGFLRGRGLFRVDISQVADTCDLSVLSEMPRLRLFGCRSWKNYDALASLPPVRELQIVNMRTRVDLSALPELQDVGTLILRSAVEIDLRALAGKSLHLDLNRRQRHIGLDELGPDVTISWID